MTEPSEHARAARKILEVIPQFSDNLLYEDCITGIIEAATAELKAENKELRQQVQDWEHQYKLLAARHPANNKELRNEQGANE